jgi:hypothetical protein
MTSLSQPSHFHCACGRTAYEARGRPLATVACYCRDCQAAGRQIDALPNGRGGVAADGGMVSSIFRKDRVTCVRGSELLVEHKLRPESKTVREIASCCNSSISTRFENQAPIVTLRTFARDASLIPDMCVFTKHAPATSQIAHAAPRYAGIPLRLILKVVAARMALRSS